MRKHRARFASSSGCRRVARHRIGWARRGRRAARDRHRIGSARRRTPAAPRRHRGVRGQATIEAIALVPVMVAIGLGVLQLLAVGYAGVLAGNAAEAAALELAAGGDARAGARQALPGWSRARARVEIDGGRVAVHLRPPSPLRALADGLEVTATAAVEAP